MTLDHGAPAGGQSIDLGVGDATVLGVSSTIHIAEGLSTTTFDALGKRPAHAVAVTASSGTSSRSLSITVTGLALAEIYFDSPSLDDGNEWLKLYNDTDVAIDLGGYTIGSGRADYT